MITVGQKLYYVPANRYRRTSPTEVTVTAVGRKWWPPAGMTVERIDQAMATLQWQDLPLMGAKTE